MGRISQADYRARAARAASALAGKTDELLLTLQKEMADLSLRQEFERAMLLRDEIQALERLQERQQLQQRQALRRSWVLRVARLSPRRERRKKAVPRQPPQTVLPAARRQVNLPGWGPSQ